MSQPMQQQSNTFVPSFWSKDKEHPLLHLGRMREEYKAKQRVVSVDIRPQLASDMWDGSETRDMFEESCGESDCCA